MIGIGTGLLVVQANALALAARVCLVSQASSVQAIAAYYGSPMGTGLLILASFAWLIAGLEAMRTIFKESGSDTMDNSLTILR